MSWKAVDPMVVAMVVALVSLCATIFADDLVVQPNLATESYRYVDQILPLHLRAALCEMDNTPTDNPLTDRGAALGRVLFYDKRLSKNNTIACASCHVQEKGFSDPRKFSPGFDGSHTKRNSMSLSNLRYTILNGNRPGFFWDERASSLEAQALMPIQDAIEMGMDLQALEHKLQKLSYYPPLFNAAFGSTKITADRISKAIAQFVRSMVSFDSKFDRATATIEPLDYSKDFDDFTAKENLGKSLFINGVGRIAEIGCGHCHVPPTFGMPKSFNTGLDLEFVDQGLGARNVPSNDPFTPNNNGKFKAPSLRNVELTAPYMHDGRFEALEQVLEHYSNGVHPHENVAIAFPENESTSQKTSGFNLTEKQKSALIAFLKTLTDASFASDPRFSNPFAVPQKADTRTKSESDGRSAATR